MITQLGFQRGHFVTRVTGNDAVHQRRTKCVSLVQPLHERVRQRPLLRITQHQFTQRIAVVINQFARNDYPAFIQRAVKMAVTLKQQAGQLGRIAYRRRIVELVARVITDPGFRCIGENKTHIRVMRQFQELIVFAIDADFTVNRAN
ncbi:hypothetical protein D3C73_1083580 [compost metagenome]